MVMLKCLFTFAVLSALLAIGVSAGSLTIELDTDSEVHKPKDARFACVIKSTTCKSPAHYTQLHYGPRLNLTTCHHDGTIVSYWHRVMPFGTGKGMFTNTFYVAISSTATVATKPESHSDCEVNSKKAELTARDVRERLADTINFHSSCNAAIQCYGVEHVDAKCLPKVKDEEDDKNDGK